MAQFYVRVSRHFVTLTFIVLTVRAPDEGAGNAGPENERPNAGGE